MDIKAIERQIRRLARGNHVYIEVASPRAFPKLAHYEKDVPRHAPGFRPARE